MSRRDAGHAAGAGVWDQAHRRLTAGLLLVISITAFEALAVATVLPATVADLGVANALGDANALGWYGWVFSGFMLANLVGIPAAGILADRGGPARPFFVGCLLFAFGLGVAGLASSMPVVVAGRIAQGLGAGALSSVAYVAVARGYSPLDQPRMLALLASAWVVPGLVGPSAAAALALPFGWRSVFLLLVPMTAAAAWLARGGLRDLAPVSGDAAPGDATMRSSLQLALGAGLALLGAETGALAPTLVCAVAGIVIGLPALRRLLPAGTLAAARGAPAALAVKGLVTFAFFGAEAFLPLALTSVRGQSLAMVGLALTAGTLAWTTGTWIQERLVLRVPRVVFVRGGLVLVAVAVAGAAGVLVLPAPGPVAIASWTLAGLGIGISFPATMLLVLERTPKGGEGAAASALQLVNVLGVAFGTGVGGAILGLTGEGYRSRTLAIAAIDAVMIGAALLGVGVAGRSAQDTSPPRDTVRAVTLAKFPE